MTRASLIIHLSVLHVLRFVLNIIPKQNNLILFSSWFGKKYADSSKYIYEYLLTNSSYKVKWYTLDKSIYKELKSKGLPVVFGNSLKGVYYQLRAKMLVSSIQLSDYNQFFLHKCIFLDLDHGFSLKQVGFAIPGTDREIITYLMQIRRGIDYWMSAPTKWCMEKIQECYHVDPDHIVKCNKPRTDVLFDKALREGKNELVETIKKGRKAIVWMPTHRSCGDVAMPVSKLLDLKRIQSICEEKNIVFIIKKHFYHKNEIEYLDNYPNIYDLTNEDLDSQVILSQADALISDYSSSYIEYLILDRPIILYAYDKEEYLKDERDLYIKLEENTSGEVVITKEALSNSIERISNDWYDSPFAEGRNRAIELYFDRTIQGGNYRAYVKNVIDELMSGNYHPNWAS